MVPGMCYKFNSIYYYYYKIISQLFVLVYEQHLASKSSRISFVWQMVR